MSATFAIYFLVPIGIPLFFFPVIPVILSQIKSMICDEFFTRLEAFHSPVEDVDCQGRWCGGQPLESQPFCLSVPPPFAVSIKYGGILPSWLLE